MGKVIIVAGGQFGSEAKGHVTEMLAKKHRTIDPRIPLVTTRVGGPNAGHTVYPEPHLPGVPLRHIPVAAYIDPNAINVVSRQSTIDQTVLDHEYREVCNYWDRPVPLFVDTNTTMIESRHKVAEAAVSTGTTGKGIGGAKAERVLRREGVKQYSGQWAANTPDLLRVQLEKGSTVIIEGTQGFGLGSHAGYYPFCTSGECTAMEFLAQTGLAAWDPTISDLEVWVVFRTYPIRIAGNSGPLFAETTWDQLGQEPEFTTVTHKQRRVGMWDRTLFEESFKANGGSLEESGVKVALTFVDYLGQDLYREEDPEKITHHPGLNKWIDQNLGFWPDLVTTGPTTGVFL